jgi:hypothetical protein
MKINKHKVAKIAVIVIAAAILGLFAFLTFA